MHDSALVALLLLFPVAVVGLSVLGRRLKLIATRVGRCESCAQRRPVTTVFYGKNTGMLLLRQTGTLEATLCRGCSLKHGTQMTLHTAVLGWWGTISFVLTLVILPANVLQLLWALALPSATTAARENLEIHRDYALALLATKDRPTVIEVLARTADAAPAEVERYLAGLEPQLRPAARS